MRAPVFEIDAAQRAGLYKSLACDGCGCFGPACAAARDLVPNRTAT